jgi:hypothetical protein
MTGLPSSIIKKYGVSKKAWAVFRGHKSSSHRRAKKSGGRMVRHRFRKAGRRRSGGMGGLMSMALPLAAGAAAGYFSSSIPVVNTLPMPDVLAGAGVGFALKRNLKGALLGAAGGYVGSHVIKTAISTGGQSFYA